MASYLLRRLLLVIPTLFGIIAINFVVVQFAPGGPVEQVIAELKGRGGGVTGQAGALRLAISRALIGIEPDDRPALKKAGFLTRDPRAKERKKYGLKKARKAPQYSKR